MDGLGFGLVWFFKNFDIFNLRNWALHTFVYEVFIIYLLKIITIKDAAPVKVV